MRQPILFFFLVVVGVVAGAPGLDERIIGGTFVTPDPDGKTTPFPYVISIENNFSHFCGGFIYNPKWIVTTASCIEKKDASQLSIVAGQVNLIDLEPTEERYAVFRVIPYDTYDNVTRKDDIALLELLTEITLDTSARDFIRFNEVYKTCTAGDIPNPTATFMGWGATVQEGSASTRLRYANVTMVENDPVCLPYSQEEFDISSMICATSSSTTSPISPCTYDEGSPLVQTYQSPGDYYAKTIVVGVLSKYSPTCNPADSSVFTRLSDYYVWLFKTAGEQVYYLPPN